MDTSTIPKVFISYNHKDQEVALKIKDKLESFGIKVIIDVEAMGTGENISGFIAKCIKESGITLSLISANSLMSAWVAMETIWSRYDETLRHRYFMPCNIDDSFFKIAFTDQALDVIDEKILEVSDTMAYRLTKGRGIEDLTGEHTRLKRLNVELPSIIGRLKNSLCVSLIDDHFDSGMEKVIKDILSRNSIPTNTIQLETPKFDEPPSPETLRRLEDPEVSDSNKTIKIEGNKNIVFQGVDGSRINISANSEKRKMEKSPAVHQIIQLLENDQIYKALEEANKIQFDGDQITTYIRKRKAFTAGLKGQDLIDWIQEMMVFLSQY